MIFFFCYAASGQCGVTCPVSSSRPTSIKIRIKIFLDYRLLPLRAGPSCVCPGMSSKVIKLKAAAVAVGSLRREAHQR